MSRVSRLSVRPPPPGRAVPPSTPVAAIHVSLRSPSARMRGSRWSVPRTHRATPRHATATARHRITTVHTKSHSLACLHRIASSASASSSESARATRTRLLPRPAPRDAHTIKQRTDRGALPPRLCHCHDHEDIRTACMCTMIHHIAASRTPPHTETHAHHITEQPHGFGCSAERQRPQVAAAPRRGRHAHRHT